MQRPPPTDPAVVLALGDPTLGGWVVTLSYLVAAWLALSVARRIPTVLRESRRERWVWLAVAAFCLFMDINKQADLQTLLTTVGKALAASGGWYEHRRLVQAAFVLVFVAVGVVAAVAAFTFTFRTSRPALAAVLGVGLLLGFAVVRAAEFHHVDEVVEEPPLLARYGFLLESAGIGVILFAALSRRRAALPARR
jgi:hypothetical protein